MVSVCMRGKTKLNFALTKEKKRRVFYQVLFSTSS